MDTETLFVFIAVYGLLAFIGGVLVGDYHATKGGDKHGS
jgi:multisubunit Na+/H+ antiporter MnhF subunit